MSVMETMKSMSSLVKEIGDIELNKKIIDLQTDVFELVEENHRLKMEVQESQKIRELGEQLIFEDNVYYLEKDGKKEGPFCATCWDYEDKLVRMHELDEGMGHYCNACFMKKKKWRS